MPLKNRPYKKRLQPRAVSQSNQQIPKLLAFMTSSENHPMPHPFPSQLRFSCITALLTISLTCLAQQPTQPKIDSILIPKKDHLLELISNGQPIRTYKVALGRGRHRFRN